MTGTPAASGGICYGAKAIAAHLGMTTRQVRYLVESKRIPFYYEGSTICTTRARLDLWIAEREAGMDLHPMYKCAVSAVAAE